MSLREFALYLAGFFGAIGASHLAARFDWSWLAVIRFLSALAGA